MNYDFFLGHYLMHSEEVMYFGKPIWFKMIVAGAGGHALELLDILIFDGKD